MELIPAIDIIKGQCVRLHQGRYDSSRVYGDDLVAIARQWRDQGAKWLHLVDLDGAKSGQPENFSGIRCILEQVPGVNIEVGGGIRDQTTLARYVDIGVQRLIIGSQAIRDPNFFIASAKAFPNRIVLGLDALDGMVMTEGWLQDSQQPATEVLARFSDLPLAAIIYTDISRDGALAGVNIEATLALSDVTDIPVFASGGVSGIDDIRTLCAYQDRISGAILGKSLYEGCLDFSQALALVSRTSYAG